MIIVRGIESIRIAEKASAPVLIGLSAAVLVWAVRTAGGWGPMLSQVLVLCSARVYFGMRAGRVAARTVTTSTHATQASQFGPGMRLHGQFWQTFWPSVTANVGFWAVSGPDAWRLIGRQPPA